MLKVQLHAELVFESEHQFGQLERVEPDLTQEVSAAGNPRGQRRISLNLAEDAGHRIEGGGHGSRCQLLTRRSSVATGERFDATGAGGMTGE